MPSLSLDQLVIGISSRALFDLTCENKVFEEEGLEGFRRYQRDNESVILAPGGAFPLVKALLGVNDVKLKLIDVVLMSKNHPDISKRIFNSIDHYQLPIVRAALTGGQPIAPYFQAYGIKLVLSADRADVQSAIDAGLAAGLIYDLPVDSNLPFNEIRFAFDGDGVLFSDEADRVYKAKGLEAYFEYEKLNAKKPLPDGPFAPVLRLIHKLQRETPENIRTRVALVTARNVPAHERALRTLDAWDVRLDEAHFLGTTPKHGVLQAFQPHIFFDDREDICLAATRVPTAQVLLPTVTEHSPSSPQLTLQNPNGKAQFLLICRGYLGKQFGEKERDLGAWYHDNLDSWGADRVGRFIDELDLSVRSNPPGEQRRAAGPLNDKMTKLMTFLSQLKRKH